MSLKTVLVFLFFCMPVSSFGGEGWYLDQVEGDVSVTRNGQETKVESFEGLLAGDILKTGDGSARVVYPDSSHLSLGENSNLTLKPNESSANSVELNGGEIHAQIEKGNSTTHKFFIRTGSAVMGVRGTEFVVSENHGEGDLHTLNGQVDVAQSRDELVQGKGLAVRAEETIHAGRQGFSAVSHFRRAEFLEKFRARHPQMMKFFKRQIRAERVRRKMRERVHRRRN